MAEIIEFSTERLRLRQCHGMDMRFWLKQTGAEMATLA